MRRCCRVLILLFPLVSSVLTPACTDVALEGLPPAPPPEVDNKLEITGQVCTQNPEDLVFPIRVLFLVDCSESMEVNDPIDPDTGETGKERAVREAVEALMAGEGDVKISIVRFSSESTPLTAEQADDGTYLSYFSGDIDFIRTRIPLLRETDRTTNYLRALSEAYAEIRKELADNSEQSSLALSTYHVIMITDGIPDDEGEETRENSTENILDGVKAIMELGRVFHVGKVTVNTGLIETGNAVVDLQAEELLVAMKDEGGPGAYRSFASGGDLNFVYIDLTASKRVFTLNTLVAQNINAKVDGSSILPDSDGDGVSDILETQIKSNPYDPDSDGDGCRDGVEYRFKTSGLDPIYPGDCPCFLADYCFDENENGICDCPEGEEEGSCCVDADGDELCDCIDVDANGLCDPSNYSDADGDGLNDCEEMYSGTNRSGADSDGDGLLDFLEVKFGTSPDIYDVEDDLDWDAVTNFIEVRTSTDPLADSEGRSKQAFRYKIVEAEKVSNGQNCFDFEVSNISLTEVLPDPPADVDFELGPAGQGYSGKNRVMVFAGEVPFDDPESYARYRVACVEANFIYEGNYKYPPSGKVTVGDADFIELPEFDADVHCIPPGGRR